MVFASKRKQTVSFCIESQKQNKLTSQCLYSGHEETAGPFISHRVDSDRVSCSRFEVGDCDITGAGSKCRFLRVGAPHLVNRYVGSSDAPAWVKARIRGKFGWLAVAQNAGHSTVRSLHTLAFFKREWSAYKIRIELLLMETAA